MVALPINQPDGGDTCVVHQRRRLQQRSVSGEADLTLQDNQNSEDNRRLATLKHNLIGVGGRIISARLEEVGAEHQTRPGAGDPHLGDGAGGRSPEEQLVLGTGRDIISIRPPLLLNPASLNLIML